MDLILQNMHVAYYLNLTINLNKNIQGNWTTALTAHELHFHETSIEVLRKILARELLLPI